MSWWNAKYTNGDGDNEITFGSKYYERAKAVEKVCQAVIDKKVKTPDDVAVVTRCKDCKHSALPSELTRRYGKPGTLTCHNRYAPCNKRNVSGDDFCSYGERKEGANADNHD